MACKWMNNRSVLLLSSALEGMNDIFSVQRREFKDQVFGPCPKVVKHGWADIIDQRTTAYHLDRKSSVRFYLCIFLDSVDITCVNSYLIYNMKHPNKLSLLDCKIIVAKNLIQCRDHLRGRTNLNRLIILENIYQITKRCENDACTVQRRVKKTEHLSSVWLVTFHYA